MGNVKKNIWKKSLSGLLSVVMAIGLVLGVSAPPEAQAAEPVIDSMDVQVNWSKVPTLVAGGTVPELTDEGIATASGTGVGLAGMVQWAVKALPAHIPAGYITQEQYDYYETYNYWVPLSYYVDGDVNYSINTEDTYGLAVGVMADDGYVFADAIEADITSKVSSNVGVEKVLSQYFGDPEDQIVANGAICFFKLGTISEIAEEKGETPSDSTPEETVQNTADMAKGSIVITEPGSYTQTGADGKKTKYTYNASSLTITGGTEDAPVTNTIVSEAASATIKLNHLYMATKGTAITAKGDLEVKVTGDSSVSVSEYVSSYESAILTSGNLKIGGSEKLELGGSNTPFGISASGDVEIATADVEITAKDYGINADGNVTLNSGKLMIGASTVGSTSKTGILAKKVNILSGVLSIKAKDFGIRTLSTVSIDSAIVDITAAYGILKNSGSVEVDISGGDTTINGTSVAVYASSKINVKPVSGDAITVYVGADSNSTTETEYTQKTTVVTTAEQKYFKAVSTAFQDAISGTAVMSGEEKCGETLSVRVKYSTDEAAVYTYQWYRGDEAIEGATESTYTLTSDDKGAVITCKVTQEGKNGCLSVSTSGPVTAKEYYATVINGTGDGLYEEGTTVTIKADTIEGKTFKEWNVTGEAVVTLADKNAAETTFTMPAENVTIEAVYGENSGEDPAEPEKPGDSGNTGSSSGSSSSSSSTVVTVPVSGSQNSINVTTVVTDSTATVISIDTSSLNKVINEEVKTGIVEIDLTGLKTDINAVSLPIVALKEISEAASDKNNDVEGLSIKFTTATVELDAAALAAVTDQAEGSDLKLVVEDSITERLNTAQTESIKDMQVVASCEAYFTSNGKRIGDFRGGEALVKIPYVIPADHKAAGYSVWYVADNGAKTRFDTGYDKAEGCLAFRVEHFSHFVVVYSEEDAQKAEAAEAIELDNTFRKLCLRVDKSTKTTNKLVWAKVSDADGYVVYGSQCNTKTKTYKVVKQEVIKDGNTTTWTDKGLKSGTYYKYYVKAYKLVDGKKVFIAKSKTVHATTTGGKYGNAKSVKVNDTDVTLDTGDKFTIQASQVKVDKTIQRHTAIKYESSNSKVATVNSKGVITAKKAGSCYIYVYAQNGVYKKVKVTVKKA